MSEYDSLFTISAKKIAVRYLQYFIGCICHMLYANSLILLGTALIIIVSWFILKTDGSFSDIIMAIAAGVMLISSVVYIFGEAWIIIWRMLAKYWYYKAAENGYIEAMYKLGELYRSYRVTYYDLSNHVKNMNIAHCYMSCKLHYHSEAECWFKNAALRGHIKAQKALSEMFLNYEAYMWAYLAYLCEGAVNSSDKPAPRNYLLFESLYDLNAIKNAEAKAQKLYNEIMNRKRINF